MNLKKIPFSHVGDLRLSTEDITRSLETDALLAKFNLKQLVRIRTAVRYEIKQRKETT